MNNKVKKMLPMASIFCTALVSSALHADSSMDTTTTTTYKEITPPAGLHIDGGAGFAISGDFLYWETRQDGLEFAYSGQSGNVPASATLAQGQVYYPGFSYQPGFKVALEADLGHDNWDLAAEYSWLIAKKQTNSVTQDFTTSTLYPTIITPGVTTALSETLTSASGVWGLHYNVVNLELGRNYFISENLTFRPHYGLSGAWFNQTYTVNYGFDSASLTPSALLQESYSQKFWGVGFRTGLDSGWHFDENWSIYGDFAAAVLWSSYKVSSSETDNFVSPAVYNYNTQSQTYGVQTVIDLEMGLRWSMVFDENSFGMMLQAGWDQQVWINHNQISSGNLNLQGLVVKARFDF
jgi:hypothetical protein